MTFGKLREFTDVTLSERQLQKNMGDDSTRMKVRIELREKTNTIPLNGDTLLINRANGFSRIDSFIYDHQERININYNEAFGVSTEMNLFELRLNDADASGIIGHVEDTLKKMVSPIEEVGVKREYLQDITIIELEESKDLPLPYI